MVELRTEVQRGDFLSREGDKNLLFYGRESAHPGEGAALSFARVAVTSLKQAGR